MKKREVRQEEIRRIIRSEGVRRQRDLVQLLCALGYKCTQATVSRDITEMGLHKTSEGYYVLAEDMHLQRMVSDLVESVVVAGNLVVVKTTSGTAQGVAAALDAASLPGVLGSVAGDDTILIVVPTLEDSKTLVENIDKYMLKRRK